MQIKMLTHRPAPGGTEPCYLAGVTYTLATEGEIAMAEAFVAKGAAMATGGLVTNPVADTPAVLQGTDFVLPHETVKGLAALAGAGEVTVEVAADAVEQTVKGFKGKHAE